MRPMHCLALFAVLSSCVACSSPTKPESIVQGGVGFSFVGPDHYYIQTEFRPSSYAYVTIIDSEIGLLRWQDTVRFISAGGDTELVALHPVMLGNQFEYLPASTFGASIYLGTGDITPFDGVLSVLVGSSNPPAMETILAIATAQCSSEVATASAVVRR